MNETQLKQYITDKEETIVGAMQRLDNNAGGVLYVVDDEVLIGSLSDGDIRRWIIKSGDVNAAVGDVMRRDVRVLYEGEENSADEFMAGFAIESVPILDRFRHIKDIVMKKMPKRAAGEWRTSLADVPIIVMAGGKGTRLYPYTKILPKPLIPVEGVPILERILDRFYEFGAKDFYLTVNYRKEMIRSYFTDIDPEYHIHYIEEDEPLGTAGSIRLISEKFDRPVFITNCDILIRAEYDKVLERHKESGNCMTIVSSVKNSTLPYGVLHVKEDGVISSIEEKPTFSNLINTGMYVIDPEVISYIPKGKVFHMTDLIEVLMNEGKPIGMFPISENSFLDMGELEEMRRMEEVLRSGGVS